MGGAGYIGSHTVKHLLNNGYQVVVADNLIYGHREAVDKRAIFEHADLLDTYSLQQVFDKHKIDAVIHFAAFAYNFRHMHKRIFAQHVQLRFFTRHITNIFKKQSFFFIF